MSKSERLKALLAAGFFPEELPPSFTTADFAKYRRAIGTAWAALPNYPQYPKTSPERFSIPKVTEWRRELAIVNPIAQYHVAKLIADDWQQISKHLSSCSFGVEEGGVRRVVVVLRHPPAARRLHAVDRRVQVPCSP